MITPQKKFALPAQIDGLLASATRYLRTQGDREDLVAIIANSRVEVEEEVDYDGWDGGQSGHEIRLHAPEPVFHAAIPNLEKYGPELCELLNRLAHVPREHVARVLVCLDVGTVPSNWREESGALLTPPTLAVTSTSDISRLWGDGGLRVFLSHRAAFKKETKELKDELAKYGAAAFVAHEDIEPTRHWQKEIERALGSMDVLVTLLTKGFAESFWTNQEVGVAIGRGIRVVSVRLDEDPRGFVGESQAISGRGRSSAELASSLVEAFSVHATLAARLQGGLVRQWEEATNFIDAIRTMDLLDACKTMSTELLGRIERAYEVNDQLHNSVGVNKKYPAFVARMKSSTGG
jgi:hypothetical protein